VFRIHSSAVLSVSPSPDGRYVLSGAADGTVHLSSLDSGLVIRRWSFHLGPVTAVGFSPGQRYVISASDDSTLVVAKVGIASGNYMVGRSGSSPHQEFLATQEGWGEVLESLGSNDFERSSSASELLLGMGEEVWSAIEAKYPREGWSATMDEDTFQSLVRQLEDQTPDVRDRAVRTLGSKGHSLLSRVDDLVSRRSDLPFHSRQLLLAVRQSIKLSAFEMGDCIDTRLVMTLLEAPQTKSVRRILWAYSHGPAWNYAAHLARRGVGPGRP
jgi:hypothetical protein